MLKRQRSKPKLILILTIFIKQLNTMIPFFRKIRKKMADDNRPLKYMRYAIGEIVLVVIGILIALQINTWNEDRKKRITEKNYFTKCLVLVKSHLNQMSTTYTLKTKEIFFTHFMLTFLETEHKTISPLE
jgi:hypothetical protein